MQKFVLFEACPEWIEVSHRGGSCSSLTLREQRQRGEFWLHWLSEGGRCCLCVEVQRRRICRYLWHACPWLCWIRSWSLDFCMSKEWNVRVTKSNRSWRRIREHNPVWLYQNRFSFSSFSFSLLPSIHNFISEMQFCTRWTLASKWSDWQESWNLASSAKDWLEIEWRSIKFASGFVYKMNKTGPRTEPGRTPKQKIDGFELLFSMVTMTGKRCSQMNNITHICIDWGVCLKQALDYVVRCCHRLVNWIENQGQTERVGGWVLTQVSACTQTRGLP